MATVALKKTKHAFGPDDNGILMTPGEFDRADFDENSCYELINGVLIVSPIPSESEVDPNDELGYLLRRYKEEHPEGSILTQPCPSTTSGLGKIDAVPTA